jgi:hypothetical protein
MNVNETPTERSEKPAFSWSVRRLPEGISLYFWSRAAAEPGLP